MPRDSESNDGDASDHSASLARLRLFLAPHSSPPKPVASSHEPCLAAVDGMPDAPQEQSESLSPAGLVKEDCAPELAAGDGDIDDDDLLSGQVTIPAPGAAASVSPLSQSTKEFARVKYLLQCCLPGYAVRDDVAMWDMTNPSLVAQYAQHAQGLLELDSWVAVNDLGAALSDVHSYGFTSLDANESGMKFTTGNLPLGGVPAVDKGTRQLVLCKIAVGRSLVIASEEEAKSRLPPGYNSFYLQPPPSPQQDSDAAERGYYHEYILDSTYQILPQYLVRFRFSALGSKSAGPCALCEKRAAVVVCRACEAEICSSCDQEVHSANKLVSRHKRVPLRPKAKKAARAARRRSSAPSLPAGATTDETSSQDADANAVVGKQLEEGLADAQPPCRFHDDKRVEFYCSVCEVPVCVHCKMVGDHSVGDKGSHRLLTIADAYELSLRESLKPDPLVESRKSVIDNKLFALAAARADVLRNKEEVEAAVQHQCQQALEHLEQEVRGKVRVLDGETLEFQRQLQQIEWTEDTLEDLRATSSAVEFLSTWNQHKAVRAGQRDFPAFAHGAGAEHVKGDLELVGRLQVVSGEQISIAVSGDSSDASNDFSSARTSRKHDSLVLDQQRTPSEPNDIRKRLLSAKPAAPSEYATPSWHALADDGIESHPAAVHGTSTLLSARGIEVIQEIRSELLAQSAMLGARSSARRVTKCASPSLGSRTPTRVATRMVDSPIRALTMQIRKSRGGGSSSMTPQGSRLVSDAWATLLRQELALGTPTQDLNH